MDARPLQSHSVPAGWQSIAKFCIPKQAIPVPPSSSPSSSTATTSQHVLDDSSPNETIVNTEKSHVHATPNHIDSSMIPVHKMCDREFRFHNHFYELHPWLHWTTDLRLVCQQRWPLHTCPCPPPPIKIWWWRAWLTRHWYSKLLYCCCCHLIATIFCQHMSVTDEYKLPLQSVAFL